MQNFCKHPDCTSTLSSLNKSRFCKNHSEYSTLRRYAKLKKQCKKRNLPFNISFKDFLTKIKASCYYCGTDLMVMTGSGLDRINNQLGYSKRNTIGCCPTCNHVRGNFFTSDEFKLVVDFIRKMRNNVKQIWPQFTGFNKTKRRKRHGI